MITHHSFIRRSRAALASASCLLVIGLTHAHAQTTHSLQLDNTTNKPTGPVSLSSPNWVDTLNYANLPPISSTIFVDGVNGSDMTGTRGTYKAFASLQAACSAASDGDTIILHGDPAIVAGSANVMAAHITILGNGATITASSQTDYVKIQVTGAFCSISDLVIDGIRTNGASYYNAGLITVAAPSAHLRNVYVHDAIGSGFRMTSAWDDVTIEHCRADRCFGGISTEVDGTADIHNASFLFNDLYNNRRGGILSENNSSGSLYAIFNEKIIGNFIHSDVVTDETLGIELFGNGIAGKPTIPHQKADVSHNTVENQTYGISLNSTGYSDVSHNIVTGSDYVSIEFANSLGCTASDNDLDCSGGSYGYSVVNKDTDAGHSVDLHLSGGRIVNFSGTRFGVGIYNVSGVLIDNVSASGATCALASQLSQNVTLQNSTGVLTAVNRNSVFVETGNGQTVSGFQFINNRFLHVGTSDYSVFQFYCAGSGTVDNVLIKNNYTDVNFCGSGFVGTSGVALTTACTLTGNIPASWVPGPNANQNGFVNSETLGYTLVDYGAQTPNIGTPALRINQRLESDGIDVLGGSITFSADLLIGGNATLGGIASWGNDSAWFGGLAFFYKPNSGYPSLAEGMRLDQTGQLGIGTKTPTALLEVNGTAKIDGTLTANDLYVGTHHPVDTNGLLHYANNAALTDTFGNINTSGARTVIYATGDASFRDITADHAITVFDSATGQPAAPPKGATLWYSNTDHKLHALDQSGTDHPLW